MATVAHAHIRDDGPDLHSPAFRAPRPLAPAAAIAVLAWAVVGTAALTGGGGAFAALDDLGRTLVVGAGAIAVMRWRLLDERGLLATGLVLMVGGFVRPGGSVTLAMPLVVAGGALLVAVGAWLWTRRTPASQPIGLFVAFVGQSAWAEAAVPGAAALFVVIAALFAADGLSRGVRRAFRLQGNELAAARAEEAAARARREEREHDIRSALMAIDGAARTLERYHDRLDDENRAMLANALSSEVSRLQKLITEVPAHTVEPFAVAAAVAPVVALARTEGLDITAAVAAAMHAIGRPEQTAQIVRTLLDNAHHHAPGSPVRIRAERRGPYVALIVEDRGPGIASGEHAAIFQRGRRGSGATPGTGQGLGLSTAAGLAAAQGGELSAEDRPGGGASFVLRLRAAGR